MYRMSWPNRITLLRILLIGPFVVALLSLQDPTRGDIARWSALGIFAAMAVSDGLDGYLARRFKQETALGRFLDPLADKILVLCSVILLAHEGTHVTGMKLPPWVAVMAVGKDIIVLTGFCVVYLITSRVFIHPRLPGKLCTTLQLLMIIAILLSPDLPEAFRWLAPAAWWAASITAAVAIIDYFHLAQYTIDQHEAATSAGGPGAPPGSGSASES